VGAKLGSKGPMADINVTPLIDVMLVLLIIFMVVTPMLQSGLPVDLPRASQTTTVNDVGQHIVISVGNNRACKEFPCDLQPIWLVEQEPVTKDTLVDQINDEWRENNERSLLIKADSRLRYRQVRELMDILADHRMTTVLIAAEKEG